MKNMNEARVVARTAIRDYLEGETREAWDNCNPIVRSRFVNNVIEEAQDPSDEALRFTGELECGLDIHAAW